MLEWSNQVAFYLKHERNADYLEYVEQLKQDNKVDELKRLFGSGRLTFGTAGIRGRMGPGLCQMNDLIIIQTTQGLASYLLELYGEALCKKRGVIIGHDARHNSARFSRLAALAFLQKLIPVYYCDRIIATPLIAHGVTYFNCYCGIMITASHNPKQDNGYKVYWANGAQIQSPHDKNIQQHIMKEENLRPWSSELSWKHEYLSPPPPPPAQPSEPSVQQPAPSSEQQQQQQQATKSSTSSDEKPASAAETPALGRNKQNRLPTEMSEVLFRVYDELCKNYFAYIQRLVSEQGQHHLDQPAANQSPSSAPSSSTEPPPPPLAITYTSMHGVGHEFLTRALKIAGFKHLHPVKAQMAPDPDFPTVKFPNPEEAGALDLAFDTAASTNSTLILANDPDADRCAAALYCPKTRARRVLSGNEIGALLGWWAWHRHQTAAGQQQHQQQQSGRSKSASTSAKPAPTSGGSAALAQGHSSSSSGGQAGKDHRYIDDDDDDDDDTGAAYKHGARHEDNNDRGAALALGNKRDEDDDDDDDDEIATDRTPATPISKPIIGEGYVQVTWIKGPHHHERRARQLRREREQQQKQKGASISLKGAGASKRPEYCYMLTTAVSSRFLQTMARIEGFSFIETLTGFKYMGNVAHDLLKRGKSVLFAYEEAIGYMVDAQILDKDGVSAAVQLAQCAAYLAARHNNRTLEGQLDWLWTRYGYHYSLNSYYLCHEPLTIRAIFHDLQSNYPKSFKSAGDAGEEFVITRIRDLNNGIDNGTADHKPDLPTCASSFMVTFFVGNEIRFTIRTSGTEPKIKYYSEIVTPPVQGNEEVQRQAKLEAQARLERFVRAAVDRCLKPSVFKLAPATGQ